MLIRVRRRVTKSPNVQQTARGPQVKLIDKVDVHDAETRCNHPEESEDRRESRDAVQRRGCGRARRDAEAATVDGDPQEQFCDRDDDGPVVLPMNAQCETSLNVPEGRGLEAAKTGDETSAFDTGWRTNSSTLCSPRRERRAG